MHAALEMKRLGKGYDHMHLMDFREDWDASWSDVQLSRVYEAFRES